MRAPSLGFVWLSAVALGTVAFFAWGLSSPPLDDVWKMTIELDAGSRGRLETEERRKFAAALKRHPKLAADLVKASDTGIISSNVSGRVTKKYAYLIRVDDSDPKLVVTYDGVKNDGDAQVRARIGGKVEEGTATRDEPFEWSIPDGPYPQFIELRFPGMKKKDAVHVRRETP